MNDVRRDPLVCVLCERRLVEWEPVFMLSDGDITRASYVPFLEDLRVAGAFLAHLACFAERAGMRKLAEVLRESDLKRRDMFWQLMREAGRTP